MRKNALPGTFIAVVRANGVSGIRYYLSESEPCKYLDIHSISGALYLIRRLNIADTGVSLNCTVTARNSQGQENTTVVGLNVSFYLFYYFFVLLSLISRFYFSFKVYFINLIITVFFHVYCII